MATHLDNIIAWFCGESRSAGPRVVMVCAHPDDETIGAGARLARLDPIALIYLTDGAPRDAAFSLAAGCGDRAEYARLRQRELTAALELGGVDASKVLSLAHVDQEAAHALPETTTRLQRLFADFAPDVVLTHPYEGGHPDHDAAAFTVHAAAALLPATRRPALLELAYYFDDHGTPRWGEFAGPSGRSALLSSHERKLKSAMLACFRSQADVLARFPRDVERVRPAPAYDFAAAPPPGQFLYDQFGWSMRSDRYLPLARAALDQAAAARSASAAASVGSAPAFRGPQHHQHALASAACTCAEATVPP